MPPWVRVERVPMGLPRAVRRISSQLEKQVMWGGEKGVSSWAMKMKGSVVRAALKAW